MKTLHIVRHGKSSWDLPGISDVDRPLIEKGIVNNYMMAEGIKLKYSVPEIIYCSPAIRAIHTAIIFSMVMRVNFNAIIIKSNFYESAVSAVLDIIEESKSSINNLMIVGHNPVFTELANLFLPENIANIPTSGIVTLQFDLKNWKISHKTPVSSNIGFPKKD
jgi:Phosphohistidine phosphatase SixA